MEAKLTHDGICSHSIIESTLQSTLACKTHLGRQYDKGVSDKYLKEYIEPNWRLTVPHTVLSYDGFIVLVTGNAFLG